MTLKDYNKTRADLKRLVKRWRKPLGLDDYHEFAIYYDNQYCEENKHTAARISSDWRYKDASVTFYLPKCTEIEPEELEYVFLHEVMHAKVNQMRYLDDDDVDHEERVCTELAMMIQLIRDTAAEGKL